MHAITYTELGPARDVLKLVTLPDQRPKSGEVRVTLAYSGANPSDTKSRAGRPGMERPAFDMIIPHSDGSGVIDTVGEGVDASRIGERVWLWNAQWQRPFGTAASHVTLPADMAVPLPAGISLETGAILGIPGLTAAQAVFGNGEVEGESILIQGGGGTVGILAVQLARWGGAHVIATCRPKDMDRVSKAGADVVLDFTAPDLAAQILAANDNVPIRRIIEVEFGLNVAVDAEVIAPNGHMAVYGSAKDMTPTLPFLPLLFKAVTIDIILIYLLPKAQRDVLIAKLHKALEEGALDCPVAQVYPLKDAALAHEAVEAGHRTGAILLDCSTEAAT